MCHWIKCKTSHVFRISATHQCTTPTKLKTVTALLPAVYHVNAGASQATTSAKGATFDGGFFLVLFSSNYMYVCPWQPSRQCWSYSNNLPFSFFCHKPPKQGLWESLGWTVYLRQLSYLWCLAEKYSLRKKFDERSTKKKVQLPN